MPLDAGRLGPSESPPAGVAEQLSYTGVGDGSCSNVPKGGSRISYVRKFFAYDEEYNAANNDLPTIGEEMYVCLRGFARKRRVQVTVRAPDGSSQRYDVDSRPGDFTFVPLQILPGDPLGKYMVAARQGSDTARSSFTVRAPNRPLARVLARSGPNRGKRDSPVRIVLVGLRPRALIELRMYREREDGIYAYVTRYRVRMDRNGEAIAELRRPGSGRPGSYLVFPNVRGLFTEGAALLFELP